MNCPGSMLVAKAIKHLLFQQGGGQHVYKIINREEQQ
jgi:hypothetical protein